MFKFIISVCVVINIIVLAYGQGFFGTPPSELGRTVSPAIPINTNAIAVGPPLPSH